MAANVATVMEKKYIGEDFYVLIPNHTIVGVIDEKTKIFKDIKDNEYATLSDESLKSEVPYVYFNSYTIDELRNLYKGQNLRDCLKNYSKDCKNIVYWSYKTDDGMTVLYAVDKEEYKKQSQKAIEEDKKLREENESNEEELIPVPDDLKHEPTDEEEMRDERVTLLLSDIAIGKYSLEELKVLKEKLENDNFDNETIIDSIDIQIESIETGDSFSKVAERREKDKLEQKKLDEELERVHEISEKIEEEKEEKKCDYFQEKIKPKRISIKDTYDNVTKTLIAQDKPARRVITEIVRKDANSKKKAKGLLITGPSGVGKTKLMELIAKYVDRPYMRVDSTQLTVPGYVGKDIEEVLWDLFIQCGEDLPKTENAILHFDEIDKKGSEKKSDVSGQGVLNVLLRLIEGSTYDACADIKNSTYKVKIDTSNMTIVASGAFVDVYKTLREQNGIGFNSSIYDKPTYRPATNKDFVEKAGFTYEYMGRQTVIKLNDLGVEEIKRVMLESDESPLKIQEQIFAECGTKLIFTEGCLTRIAKEAIENNSGVRGIDDVIDNCTWEAFAEVYDNPGKYKEAYITEETLDDSSKFTLVENTLEEDTPKVKKRGRKKKND